MGCLFRTFFVLLLLGVVGLPAAAVLFGIEKTPMVARAGDITTSDLQNARRLIERYDPRRMRPNEITTVTASAGELNTLIKSGLSALPQVASRVDVNRFGLTAGVSAELPIPQNPLGRYVNIRAAIAPSDQGLEIARFAVGSIEVPPALLRPAVRLALDHFVGAGMGEPIVASIRSVRVSGDRVAVAFRPPPALVDDLKTAAERQASVNQPRTVRVYYQRLMELDARHGHGRARSLGHVRLDGRHDFVQHSTISAGLALTGGESAANIKGMSAAAFRSRYGDISSPAYKP